jgi:flavin reductase (NADH)
MNVASPPGVDASDFRAALSRWASGVAIVSVRDAQGLAATTVSSFSSLSLSPPLVMVALAERSQTLERVKASGRFTVSLLAAGQQEAASRCAKRAADEADFDEDGHVRGSLASLACTTHDLRQYGDHLLLVGRVERLQLGAGGAPLLYWDRGYRVLAQLPAPTGPDKLQP